MIQFLVALQNKNKLQTEGLLRRFTKHCIGPKIQLEDLKAEKAEKYK